MSVNSQKPYDQEPLKNTYEFASGTAFAIFDGSAVCDDLGVLQQLINDARKQGIPSSLCINRDHPPVVEIKTE